MLHLPCQLFDPSGTSKWLTLHVPAQVDTLQCENRKGNDTNFEKALLFAERLQMTDAQTTNLPQGSKMLCEPMSQMAWGRES